jgi:hypothetical protein
MDVERKDEEGDEIGKTVEATKPLTEKVWRATKQAYVLGHGRRWTYPSLPRGRSTENVWMCGSLGLCSGHRGHHDVAATE